MDTLNINTYVSTLHCILQKVSSQAASCLNVLSPPKGNLALKLSPGQSEIWVTRQFNFNVTVLEQL